ncbi:hypothetical protein IU11_19535 [Cellulosimicrobium sp. MM]|nr:hypothetical protein IU11_19535 [Cellulosimicrobium sp. MM]
MRRRPGRDVAGTPGDGTCRNVPVAADTRLRGPREVRAVVEQGPHGTPGEAAREVPQRDVDQADRAPHESHAADDRGPAQGRVPRGADALARGDAVGRHDLPAHHVRGDEPVHELGHGRLARERVRLPGDGAAVVRLGDDAHADVLAALDRHRAEAQRLRQRDDRRRGADGDDARGGPHAHSGFLASGTP